MRRPAPLKGPIAERWDGGRNEVEDARQRIAGCRGGPKGESRPPCDPGNARQTEPSRCARCPYGASRIEARRAETAHAGSVHESPAPGNAGRTPIAILGNEIAVLFRGAFSTACRLDQFHVADAEGLGELIECDNGGIALSALQPADILLGEAGNVRELLLRQAFFQPDPPHIPSDQGAHVHGRRIGGLHIISLSPSLFVKVQR